MSTRTILYAEDEENDVFLTRRAFELAEAANPLRIVRNGEEAIDYLCGAGLYASRHEFPLPFLVLLDVKMPRKSGLEVLKWIRAQPAFRTLLVLMLTSSGHEGDIQTAYDLGANAYLIKPSGQDDLMHVARALKDFWVRWNRQPPDPNSPLA